MASGKSGSMPIRRIHIALSLAALAGLASCGGGSDGTVTGSHTAFPTVPANLTSANAPTFARFADLAARAGATMRLGDPTLSGVASPYTDSGCGTPLGSLATLQVTPSTGNVNGTVTYTGFSRCFDMRVNGTSTVAGTIDFGPSVNAINFTGFSGLSFTAGAETIQASGSAALDWTSAPPAATYLMTLNATASGGTVSFQVDNFGISSQITAGVENISINGRLTTSEGFVDITTVTTPQLVVGFNGLVGGKITMSGASTVATVVYNGSAPPTITFP